MPHRRKWWGNEPVINRPVITDFKELEAHDAEVRAKAIDEFAEALKVEYAPCQEADDIDVRMYKMVCKRIDMVAEQLKEGGK